jgi:hypothetical protein
MNYANMAFYIPQKLLMPNAFQEVFGRAYLGSSHEINVFGRTFYDKFLSFYQLILISSVLVDNVNSFSSIFV